MLCYSQSIITAFIQALFVSSTVTVGHTVISIRSISCLKLIFFFQQFILLHNPSRSITLHKVWQMNYSYIYPSRFTTDGQPFLLSSPHSKPSVLMPTVMVLVYGLRCLSSWPCKYLLISVPMLVIEILPASSSRARQPRMLSPPPREIFPHLLLLLGLSGPFMRTRLDPDSSTGPL